MKLKKTVLMAAVMTAVAFGQANAGHDGHHDHGGHSHGEHSHDARMKKTGKMYSGNTIRVDVNGLVCDFCAQSIRKVFLKTGAVEEADVNLRKKVVNIYLKKGKNLSDKRVKQLLEDSGYVSVAISRSNKGARK